MTPFSFLKAESMKNYFKNLLSICEVIPLDFFCNNLILIKKKNPTASRGEFDGEGGRWGECCSDMYGK